MQSLLKASQQQISLSLKAQSHHPLTERYGRSSCKDIPCTLPREWQQEASIFPKQRMKAKVRSRKQEPALCWQSHLQVLSELSGREDSCHWGCISIWKRGFIYFWENHHFHQSLISCPNGHIHIQRNCKVWGLVTKSEGLGTKNNHQQKPNTR